ncbi:MAG: helix-turn-helix transcriptional regulator [Bacteroidia bacterium]
MGRGTNKKYLINVAKRIKQLRIERNLTQEDFYNDTGIHIGRVETVKSNLTIATLLEICDYFEISIQEFFEDV